MKRIWTLVGMATVLSWGSTANAQTLSPFSTVEGMLAIVNTVPPPADDPLLDANGNVVLDAFGKPVSDPNETFHQVTPLQFDPDHTFLVQSAWLNGTGCPTASCLAPTDPKDQHNEGLLLAKSGPTPTNASAIAELKKVRGTTVTQLGYDIRKEGGSASPLGSHCGAGAPRFNLVLPGGAILFIGCNSPPATTQVVADQGWTRLRWSVGSIVVDRIFIVFDEGPDTGPDFLGAAFLDNVEVNGQVVGAGPTNAR